MRQANCRLAGRPWPGQHKAAPASHRHNEPAQALVFLQIYRVPQSLRRDRVRGTTVLVARRLPDRLPPVPWWRRNQPSQRGRRRTGGNHSAMQLFRIPRRRQKTGGLQSSGNHHVTPCRESLSAISPSSVPNHSASLSQSATATSYPGRSFRIAASIRIWARMAFNRVRDPGPAHDA